MAIYRSVLVLICGCVLVPSQGRTELRNGQKVILTVPAGYEHRLVTDDCTIARLLVINEPYRKGAEPAMKKRPEMTYETRSAGVIQEVDPEAECVWVEVQPDGPGGWLYNSLVELTPAEKKKEAQRQASLQNKQQLAQKAATARREAMERVDPSKPLQLLDHSGSYDESTTTIVGRVRNNTDRPYSYAQITFSLFDNGGNQVGTTIANIANLEPRAVWKFKAIGWVRATRFKLSGLFGR